MAILLKGELLIWLTGKKCAWNKFHKFKHILLNKHISLRLRLKFFDSVISPTISVWFGYHGFAQIRNFKIGFVETTNA